MRKVIHKVFLAWQAEKEEAWLNEMAAKGLALVAVGFCRYEFEDCTPGEYQYRIELLKYAPAHPESQQYIKFIEDTGAEQIGSYMRWVYFRKKTSDGPFDLFSDLSSRISHLNRIISLLFALSIFNLGAAIYNLIIAFTFPSLINGIAGAINLAVEIPLMIGLLKLTAKRDKLKKDQKIFE